MNVDAAISLFLSDLLDPEGRGLDAACLAGAVQDMKGRVRGMPRYMGLGMTALSGVFLGAGYTRAARPRRLARIEAMRRAPVSLLRDFVEFWEKMGTFTYWSRVEHAQQAHA